MAEITPEMWRFYDENGFVNLGRVLDEQELSQLQQRIDDIMLGRLNIRYDRIFMQLDSDTGKYEDTGRGGRGHKGASLNYRKIQDLEFDPVFLQYMQRPIFREICARVYGPDTSIAAFRAMFMNKPARKGTFLPWHQDRWNFLDRDPLITVWTALDPATKANGCVQIIRGSHRLGVINPDHNSGFLTEEQVAEHVKPEKIEYVEVQPGAAVLMHNWLIHGSDINRTDIPRRAFSVCYMDAGTRTHKGTQYSVIFGDGALTPPAVERELVTA